MTRRKIRRVKRTSELAPAAIEPDVGPVSKPTVPALNSSGRRREVSEAALRREYAYVLLDLRRMFIIAASMFILLIVLGLLV